jgi:hypothetical protein
VRHINKLIKGFACYPIGLELVFRQRFSTIFGNGILWTINSTTIDWQMIEDTITIEKILGGFRQGLIRLSMSTVLRRETDRCYHFDVLVLQNQTAFLQRR